MIKHSWAVLGCACTLSLYWNVVLRGGVQQGNLSEVVAELKNARTSDAAAVRLLNLGKTNPSLRTPLVKELRLIIAAGPVASGKTPWINSINLAGDLKLSELAPDLASWVDRLGSSFSIVPLREQMPAGAALAQMGDPAIPALINAAENGTRAQKDMAPMFIGWIGTPAARRALQALLKQETDPKRKERTQNVLKGMEQKP